MSKKNVSYEDKLYDEILVDCKDVYEQNMSWYYYVCDELEFPFKAKTELKKRTGQKELKEVEVLGLSEDSCDFEESFDLKVDIVLNEYIIQIPLKNLKDVNGSEKTTETIGIWKYWKNNN